jgi:hypothetical protein
MLNAAITVLFTLTALVAGTTVMHCLIGARAAYVRLMREGEVLRAGLALQAHAIDMALRPAPRRIIAIRRVALPAGVLLARPAFAA